MPNRILREGILTSERVNSLSYPAEVFYRRLMSVVDDFGRYYAKPDLLRAACYPLQIDKVGNPDVVKWIGESREAGLVRTYTCADGKVYLEVLDFRQQQRAKDSKFPHPHDISQADATQARSTGAASAHLDGGGVVDEKKHRATASAAPVDKFEEAWGKYPKRAGNNPKTDARKAWTARVKGGVDAGAMLASVDRYAKFCEVSGKVGTEYVLRAATFFGPSKPFEQDFAPPPPKGKNGAAAKPWYLTASGIEAKGKEYGIEAPEGKEGWAEFKDVVYQRAGVTAEMLKIAKVDHG